MKEKDAALVLADENGHTDIVRDSLAAGANVHAVENLALLLLQRQRFLRCADCALCGMIRAELENTVRRIPSRLPVI
jgi:hypothetical protein